MNVLIIGSLGGELGTGGADGTMRAAPSSQHVETSAAALARLRADAGADLVMVDYRTTSAR